MTQTAVVTSPYNAGLAGHIWTHLQVELSAKVPAGHCATHLIELLSANEF